VWSCCYARGSILVLKHLSSIKIWHFFDVVSKKVFIEKCNCTHGTLVQMGQFVRVHNVMDILHGYTSDKV
jgi:hypothetical protein